MSCLYTHLDEAIGRYVPVKTINHNEKRRPWITDELDKINRGKRPKFTDDTDSRGLNMIALYSDRRVIMRIRRLRRLNFCFIMRD